MKTSSYWRKKCVETAKIISKIRDNYTCRRCGRSNTQGYQIHGSHIFPESKHHSLSIDPNNIDAMCAQCHFWWHENPAESGSWWHKKNKKRYEVLKKLSQKTIKLDYEKEHKKLKEILCKVTLKN